MASMRKRAEQLVVALQDSIVKALEAVDPAAPPFKRDSWTRAQGGYGTSCVFAVPSSDDAAAPPPSSVLEKAGVNVSVVHGTLPPVAVQQMRANHATLPQVEGGLPFFATGVSLVIHPRNPNAPTCHANYRYFEVTEAIDPDSLEPPKPLVWWFGGGADLTPSYLFEEDAVHFHKVHHDAAAPYGAQMYPALKKWCDEYFYIPHRQESRGIGGVFWDDLSVEPHPRLSSDEKRPQTAEEIFSFVSDMGAAFIPAYIPILSKRCVLPSTPRQRRWQLIRRGRYVEFNIMIDRGTKFGLTAPGARIESILMSLPETARWEYMSDLGQDPESEEGKLLAVLKTPKEWV